MPDIIVIGGGVIGSSIAFHLSARGAQVTLLEAGTIGGGESGKSGGFVQTHWDTLAEVRLIARSRDMFASWRDTVGGDCGFVRGGYLHVTGVEREPDVRRVHDMLVADGLESLWLTPPELATLEPLLNLDRLVGGAWEPSSGWCDALATTRSLADAARRHGAEIREGTRAHRITREHGRITGVDTSTGALACGTVVLAAGPYVSRLHVLHELALPLKIQRGQIGYVRRPAKVAPRVCGFYDEVSGVYTHPAGELDLLGWDRGHAFDDVPDPDNYKRDVDGKWVARAAMTLGYRFPALREARLERGVVGLYDFTPDGQPIVDGPIGGLTGYYLATGFSGVGFKSAPATGLGMAELVLDGNATSVSIDHLRFARFAKS